MQLTTPITTPKAAGDVQPTVADTAKRSRFPLGGLLLVLATVVLGYFLGQWVMQRRYKAAELVAAVNGKPITQEQFYRRLELLAGQETLNKMIGAELRVQFANSRGTKLTDADVNAKFKELIDRPGQKEALARSGQSANEILENLRQSMAQTDVYTQGIQVTDAEIRRFYDANTDKKNPKALYYTPESVVLAVIVTASEDKCKQAKRDMGIGIPFSTVVKTYSQDRSKANGGLLPPILRGRTNAGRIPGLEEAVFGLKIGEETGPRKFAGAWWIIRCLDKKPEATIPFDKVKEQAKLGAMLVKGLPLNARNAEKAFSEFQSKARIEAYQEPYRSTFRKP